VGAALLVGGAVGAVLGGAVAVGGPRLLARLEPAAVRRRRLRVARDLPVAADLLAACLVAGSAPEAALGAVGPAVGGPVGAALESVLVALQLGADPRAAWAPFARDPDLGPLARAVARALDSGAPLAAVVERCAEDLRQRRRSSAEVAARAVAVRAAAPLGLCFLPAFVLLGVVPTVLGLARGVLG
jgi:Flp pilus assembly protein TadB